MRFGSALETLKRVCSIVPEDILTLEEPIITEEEVILSLDVEVYDFDLEKAVGGPLGRFLGRTVQLFKNKPGFWITSKGKRVFIGQRGLVPEVGKGLASRSPELKILKDAGLMKRPPSIRIASKNISRKIKNRKPLFKQFEAKNREVSPEGAIKSWLENWAVTSSDSDTFAVTNQLAAAKEFNLPSGGKVLEQAVSGLKRIGATQPIITDFTNSINIIEKSGFQNLYKGALRAVFNNTQTRLKAAGIKQITVYRGMRWDVERPSWVTAIKPGQSKVNQYTMNPISSWTLNKDVADKFAGKTFASDPSGGGIILTARVPANQVLSLPSTGFGVPNELEITLLGKPTAALTERLF